MSAWLRFPRLAAGRCGALLVVGTLAACTAVPPPAPDEGFALDAFRWRGDASRQSEIVAVNRWGDLRVRTSEREELVVGAMIQRLGTGRDELAVRIDERADAIVVEVVAAAGRPRGRVDLTLIVPASKRLRATTRDGLAEVKYRGDVAVRTRGGAITIETSGHASARSASGSIVAKLTGVGWQRPQALVSGRGDVTLWLPDDAGLGLRLDGSHASPAGATGTGAPLVRVASRRGDVRVVPYARAAAGG